jgi:elongation factor Ts
VTVRVSSDRESDYIEDTVTQADINAALVAELRRETGAGMMDCKKALAESGGDKAKAVEYLRKKGKAAAEKRADRSAQEGIVVIRLSDDGRTAALVEVNSETDFVAKNDQFRHFGAEVARLILGWNDADRKSVEDLKAMTLPSGQKVGDVLTDLIGKIGEKLEIGRFARLHTPTGFIGHYVHSDSRLGVLVVLEGITTERAEAHGLGRDLAMQVAAASPSFVRRDEIPAEKIEFERGVEMERARAEGRPEPALPKIAEGRVNKWISEVVLLEQPFVKEPKIAVKDMVASVAKGFGGSVVVKSFIRVRVGS